MPESLHWWKHDDGAQFDLVERAGHLERQGVVGGSYTMSIEIESLVRSLLARAAAVEARVAEAERLIGSARQAAASLPETALGVDYVGSEEQGYSYPLRDELLHHLDAFLAAAPPAAPAEARGDLLPCPFCAFPALAERGEAVDDAPHYSAVVACTNCGARVEALNRASALLCWNRRASEPPPLPAEVQRVVDAAERCVDHQEQPAFDLSLPEEAGEFLEWMRSSPEKWSDLESAVAALRASREETNDG